MFHPQVCSQLDVTFPSVKWGSECVCSSFSDLYRAAWMCVECIKGSGELKHLNKTQWKLENRVYVEMKSWEAKTEIPFLFVSLFSELWAAVFALSSSAFCLHSGNSVLSPHSLLLSVLIFPCAFWGISQCWYFSKVCYKHSGRGWSLPGSCSSV